MKWSSTATVGPGLSPLARGTRWWRGQTEQSRRFIPAGAGNTLTYNTENHTLTVYPRWRGEHGHSPKQTQEVNGLSPLARGTPGFHLSKCWMWRFIPAGAGNTTPDIFATVVTPVYPRWRGEHLRYFYLVSRGTGLSPLARGTRIFYRRMSRGNRFIPAGAGNTSAAPANVSAVTVYPRWRGEHPRPSIISCASFGLSPLARGTHQEADESARHARFIPAGAGNTQFHMSRRAGSSVYPRWRGEHTKHT